MVYSCFQSISTITVKNNTKDMKYYVTCIQYLEGCFLNEEKYTSQKKEINEHLKTLQTEEERENYLSHNYGALLVHEIVLQSDNNAFSGKMLFLFISLLCFMFCTLNLVICTFIGLFQDNFIKVNAFMSSLALITGVVASIASVVWLRGYEIYTLTFGLSTIFFVLYPLIVLMFCTSKKINGK